MSGCAGEGLGRHEREDLLGEVAPRGFLLRRREIRPLHHANAVRGERRPAHLVPATRLPLEQGARADGNGVEHLLDREAVIPRRAARRRRPLERGDADHEEFVEVRAQDGQKPDPREERDAGVLGQLQHPAVEFDETQIAVEELLGIREQRRAQRVVGKPRPSFAPIVVASPRPLGEHFRSRRNRERRECPRVTQPRRPGARQQLGERQPLESTSGIFVATAGDPSRHPDFQHWSRRSSWRCAEESELPVRAAEERPQELAAHVLTVAAADGKGERGRLGQHGNTLPVHDDQGDFAIPVDILC